MFFPERGNNEKLNQTPKKHYYFKKQNIKVLTFSYTNSSKPNDNPLRFELLGQL